MVQLDLFKPLPKLQANKTYLIQLKQTPDVLTPITIVKVYETQDNISYFTKDLAYLEESDILNCSSVCEIN